jgi:hypothetical protein
MVNSQQSLKCQHQGVWRRLNISSTTTFEQLNGLLIETFGLSAGEQLNFTYVDDEGERNLVTEILPTN